MSSHRSLSRLILSLLVLLAISREAAAKSLEAQKQREFDYFALALQWPGTFCQRVHHCCSQNGCCRSEPLSWFTIHGLWPDYDDGTWPACCSSTDFDLNKISSLLPVLEKYWPTLSCGSTSQCDGSRGSFWGHEWGKHGTCSYPVIQDEYSFFSKALELYFKYNITEILSNAGFSASNAHKYPLGDVIATIKKSVGATPQLVCKRGAVQELRICFDKDFKPRDCVDNVAEDDATNSRSSCPRYVSLPTYAPLVIEDVSAADATAAWFS